MNTKLLIITFLLISFLAPGTSCKKESSTENLNPPPPYLTERKWVLDTITINPPATYNALSDSEIFLYNAALGWLKNAELTLNTNGMVTTGGNWDFGYNNWRLINNNADIEVALTGGKDTLHSWIADKTHFSYVHLISSFNCTYLFK